MPRKKPLTKEEKAKLKDLIEERTKARFWYIHNCEYQEVARWQNDNGSWSIRIKLPYSIRETMSRYVEIGLNEWLKKIEGYANL